MTKIIFKQCSRCKRELKESELIIIKHWQCDDCMFIEQKEILDKKWPTRGFFNDLVAKQIIEGLRDYANKNGSLSLNDIDEITHQFL